MCFRASLNRLVISQALFLLYSVSATLHTSQCAQPIHSLSIEPTCLQSEISNASFLCSFKGSWSDFSYSWCVKIRVGSRLIQVGDAIPRSSLSKI
ncbi:hypothetical protein RND81_05G000800 [Saponaria officinalis]|uniref:Secreted protein n=1 Tax=Saponaria officinalis TaxID=3572 RepID=A0AAW1KS58_SAPOF